MGVSPMSEYSPPPSGEGKGEGISEADWIAERLAYLARANLLRSPVEVTSAQGPTLTVRDAAGVEHRWTNFCSNNYLNLASDPRIRRATAEAIERWGFGSGASRLISGSTSLHRQAERELADFLGTEDAILLSTGYQTNVAAITALAGPGDTVLVDKLDHASLIDGARQSGARLRVYPHGDVDRLAELLERESASSPSPCNQGEGRGEGSSAKRLFVVTDSLFSMDGDFAPLAEIVALKQRFRFMLIVDEAHAIGVFGPTGRGVCELLDQSEQSRAQVNMECGGIDTALACLLAAKAASKPPHSTKEPIFERNQLDVSGQVDAILGTCSKSLGGAGGFMAGRKSLIDLLRNTARPFIFSTAPPAAQAAATIAALKIIREEPERRARLLDLSAKLRQKLVHAGIAAPSFSRDPEGSASPGVANAKFQVPNPKSEIRNPKSQIFPIILGSEARALAAQRALLARDVFVVAIRPPTVPKGTSRLRISLMCDHTEQDLDRLVAALKEICG